MRWVVLLLASASVLSGCAAPPETGPADEVTVVTDPRDLVAGNASGAHVHDYWRGQDSITVVDHGLGSGWNNLGGGSWSRVFVPADGVVVPQGTARIDVTVDWTDQLPANAYGDVTLWVKPANVVERRFVAEVGRGETVSIPTVYEEADLPHQVLSAWEFVVQYNDSAQPYNAFFGSTTLQAVAHRGLELRPFPAHPDLWLGRDEVQLLSHEELMFNIGYIGSGSLPDIIAMDAGSLVPPDAGSVEFVLRLQPDTQVGGLELQFHGADTRNWTRLGYVDAMDGEGRWTVTVEPGMGDGPYSNASLWQVRVYTTSDETDGPAYYDGAYNVTAVVRR